jgi:hypothetical protein
MRIFPVLVFILTSFTPLAMAAGEKVDIISPKDGTKFTSKVENTMEYEVTLGAAGGHIHLYLDGKEVALLRQKKGSYTFDTLAQGAHEICLKIVNKNHTPIGVERCIKVTVE